MKIMKFLASAAVISVLSVSAHAQEVQALKIATGKPDATNSQMFQSIKAVCPNIQEVTDTTGGVDNINMLVGNKVDAGIAQPDVAEFLEQTDPNVGKLRSLVALNSNYLHIITSPRGVMVDPGKEGRFGFGKVEAKFAPINGVFDLKGKTVVAHGSAQLTARILSKRLGLDLNVIDDDSPTRTGLEMVRTGQAAAFMAMGGKPVGWVEKLNPGEFQLLAMQKEMISNLGSPYFSGQLSYKNLNAFGFHALAVKNELFVRNYQGAKAKLLSELRTCYEHNLADIRETTGTHPAWQEVEDLTAVSWARFENADAKKATPVKADK